MVSNKENISNLYHYTTFEALDSIIKTGCLYISPLDEKLNDKNEYKYLPEYDKGKIYISCFTSQMNDNFWHKEDYAKTTKKGVCIKFNVSELIKLQIKTFTGQTLELCDRSIFNYTTCSEESDFGYDIAMLKKVIYVDDPTKYPICDKKQFQFYNGCCNINNEELRTFCTTIPHFSYVKAKIDANGNDQSYEKEYRIIVRIRAKMSAIGWGLRNYEKPQKPFERLLLDIKPIKGLLEVFINKDFDYTEEMIKLSNDYGFKYIII